MNLRAIYVPVAVLLALAVTDCKRWPKAMEVCKSLEATKEFSACTVPQVFEGERCPDQAEFSFTTKQGASATGTVSVCRSDDEYAAALNNMNLHNENPQLPGEFPPWAASPERRTIIYYGPQPEARVKPEQLNAMSVAIGEKPLRRFHAAACDSKCKSMGLCSVRPGQESNCIAASDDDCKQAEICMKSGLCKVGPNGLCQ